MRKTFLLFDVLVTSALTLIMILWCETKLSTVIKIIITSALVIMYFISLMGHNDKNAPTSRLRHIRKGADTIRTGGWSAVISLIGLIIWICKSEAGIGYKIGGAVVAVVIIGQVLLLGVLRTAVGSRQIKIKDHVFMIMLWWLPIVNVILIRRFYKTARREYIIEADKIELDNARAENEICSTKYPILLVHGIFFRDWQLVNYWGRIPASLIRNGAKVYYGKQQSSLAVADSAAELKETIKTVLKESGAEKVNIIAHSKGGLDSRYAISCLGMDEYVATLTTINTPHEGCDMVDFLLKTIPDGIKGFIEKRYNSIFTKLGDTAPDFMAGVNDLSAVNRREQNKNMPDSPKVSYRSYMSVMSSAGSAGFPLNLGYLLIKKLNGANDGLVWEKSAEHGTFTMLTNEQKRGISHGDVVDLMRENIEGFDVRELYVDIVSRLKTEGF